MKVIKVMEAERLEIVEEARPVAENPRDVVVRVMAAGICGSDISIYKGTSPVATYPRVIGHEFAGEVVEIGTEVTAVKLGDRVTVNPVMGCGVCRVCRRGRSNVCTALKVIGVHVDGGFREYACVPQENLFTIPEQLSWEQAAIIEPYTVAAQVTQRGGVQEGDVVLILGSGQIALTILQVCKLLGAFCIVTDIVEERLERARRFGADATVNTSKEDVRDCVMAHTEGAGADVAIDAACVGTTFAQAVECTRPAGVIVSMGFADRTIPVTELAITKNELDIRGSRLNNNQFPRVIEWIAQGKIDPLLLITDRFAFTEVVKGMDKIKNEPEATMKVVLTF